MNPSLLSLLVTMLVAVRPAVARIARGAGGDSCLESSIECAHVLVMMKDIISTGPCKDSKVAYTTETITEKSWLTNDDIQNVIASLPPQMKHTVLDCLRKSDAPVPVLRSEGSPECWLTKYFGYSLSRRELFTQHLTDPSIKFSSSFGHAPFISSTTSLSAAFNPSTNPSSSRSRTLASAQVPVLAPGHAAAITESGTPVYSPRASSAPAPVTSSFHTQSPTPELMPQKDGSVAPMAPRVATFSPSENRDANMKPIIIAVVVTGTVSFTLSAILFYCYIKCCRSDRSDNGKSERPLLTLSDFSDGSSRKSFTIGNSLQSEKIGVLSFRTDQDQNGHIASFDLDTGSKAPSHEAMPGFHNLSSDLSFPVDASSKTDPPPPPLPPMPPSSKKTPPVPPPKPKVSPHPPAPPKGVPPRLPPTKLSPFGTNNSESIDSDSNGSKTKLKPFFWDKVMANPDQSMVWHQLKSGSFQFNEEMIETLFRYNVTIKHRVEDKKGLGSNASTNQLIQIINPKKSQNLAILLRALNVGTEDVCLALTDGNELPCELIQTLLKMPPTAEEELKLRLYDGDTSQLHTAEHLLKALMDIPFAYKRLDALLYMCSFQEDISSINDSFTTLEAACQELRSSRLFLKLLEAVLKTGNRMNDGTYRGGAQAFKLDTLLKLSDVKGTDGKTTLLHFVVQEIIRTEGIKAYRVAQEGVNQSGSSLDSSEFVDDSLCDSGDQYRILGLKVVSGLSNELGNVKKAAALDAEILTSMVAKLVRGMTMLRDLLNGDMNNIEETCGFKQSLEWFVEHNEIDISSLNDKDKTIRELVKSTTDYFHGNAGRDEGLRLFVVVRDFLSMLEKVCNEVKQSSYDSQKTASPLTLQPASDPWPSIFPAIQKYRLERSSSDEDSP